MRPADSPNDAFRRIPGSFSPNRRNPLPSMGYHYKYGGEPSCGRHGRTFDGPRAYHIRRAGSRLSQRRYIRLELVYGSSCAAGWPPLWFATP